MLLPDLCITLVHTLSLNAAACDAVAEAAVIIAMRVHPKWYCV